MNALGSFLQHWWVDSPSKWHPIMGVYYLTYACPFRCPHCCDGSGVPYPQLKSKILSAEKVLELLGIMRRVCDYLVITGGEPLLHPEFERVMEGLGRLKFRGVILTTNGYLAEPMIPVLARSVDDLVFSLQTMDSARADGWYGAGRGVHQRILENLNRAANASKRKYDIILSSVVTPENIDDLYDVYRYAKHNGFRLAACPQLIGVKAHEALGKSDAYRRFYDFLIAEKKKGARIQGTVEPRIHAGFAQIQLPAFHDVDRVANWGRFLPVPGNRPRLWKSF